MASLKIKEVFCLIYSGLLFISGTILMGISTYLVFKLFYLYAFIPVGDVGPFFVIFILGVLHLFLTWLGIKGPTREHNFHIFLFLAFTIILFISEITVGIWSIILWEEVEVVSVDLMVESFNELISLNYYRKDWIKLQSELHCCGINGPTDYNKTEAYPTSCFLNSTTINNPILYTEGCKEPLINYVKNILLNGAIIGFVCAIFQIIGVFIFYTFIKTLRKERHERSQRRLAAQRASASEEVPPLIE